MPFSGDYDGSIVAVLEELRLTADLEGLAVLDLSADAVQAPVAYSLGSGGSVMTALGQSLLTATPGRPSHTIAKDRRPLLACPWILPPSRPGGLLLWRGPRSRPWTDSDHDLAASAAMLLRVAIGAGMGQVGIDRLTGIPNRRWFLDEADRHIDRLDLDVVVGTLLLVDIDDLRRVNLSLGRAQGDRILIRMASQLRAMVRPSDPVARVGADEFAIWQDGMDHLTAAERARESLASDLQNLEKTAGAAADLKKQAADAEKALSEASTARASAQNELTDLTKQISDARLVISGAQEEASAKTRDLQAVDGRLKDESDRIGASPPTLWRCR